MKKATAVFLAVLTFLSILIVPVAAAKAARTAKTIPNPQQSVDADAYMLVSLGDAENRVLAQKNAQKKKYPASLTKVVTAMVVLEHIKNIKKKTTVSRHAIEAIRGTGAQSAALWEDEKITVEDLLYLAMLFSACDACQVLAETVGGSVSKFVKMMNTYVRSLGCKNTHFVNPDGLHDSRQYTTAADLKLIMLHALQNKSFRKIALASQYTCRGSTYYHTNRMLHPSLKPYYYAYAKGIKTGYTKQAGRCLITVAKKGESAYLAIILDSPIAVIRKKAYNASYFDAKKLFEWAFHNYSERTLFADTKTVAKVKVADAKEKNTLCLVAAKPVKVILPNSAKQEDITVVGIHKPYRLFAPIAQGEKVCRAQILYKGKVIGKTTLLTGEAAESSFWSKLLRIAVEWLVYLTRIFY